MANTAKATKGKAEEKSAAHPTFAEMVIEAITKLADKGGSSFQAIKKYIAEVHKVDVEKQGAFIKKALKNSVETGKLTQLTGKGASGSFKLAVKQKPEKQLTVSKAETSSKVKKKATTPSSSMAAKSTGEKKETKAPIKATAPKIKPPKSMKVEAPAKSRKTASKAMR